VAEGTFREDLYHRLSIVELRMPSLRERVDDVDVLLQAFMDEACATSGRMPPNLDPNVRVHLRRWPWPGNIRELRNVANYVAAMTPGGRVRMEDLPPTLHRPPPEVADADIGVVSTSDVRIDLPYMEARRLFLDDFQQRYVTAILEAHDGNVSGAARAAGMDRRSIQRILKRASVAGLED